MKYKCIKGFSLPNYDDNGFLMENSYLDVEEGSIWEQDESPFRMIGTNDTIRLEDEQGSWLEITKELLSENFELYREKESQESDIEKLKPCINYEDGCEEWAGCPCVYYKAESEK